MGLVYTIEISNSESDKASSRVLSFEPLQDGFVLLGRDMADILSNSAHQHSSNFINSIFEIISAWEKYGFFRFVEWNFSPVINSLLTHE